jgi:hypothetical protein
VVSLVACRDSQQHKYENRLPVSRLSARYAGGRCNSPGVKVFQQRFGEEHVGLVWIVKIMRGGQCRSVAKFSELSLCFKRMRFFS